MKSGYQQKEIKHMAIKYYLVTNSNIPIQLVDNKDLIPTYWASKDDSEFMANILNKK